jgi:hypothetical protein
MPEHQRRLRERGYRPVQLWVPDTRTEEFAEQAHRDSKLSAIMDAEDDIMYWLEDACADVWDEK